MKTTLPAFVFSVLVALTLAPSALASDWYVDPVAGDNSNSGTSAADPWRTMFSAMAQIPAGAHTLHLLPGTYGAVSGEIFPINLRHDVNLIGDGGRDATTVEGIPALDVFRAIPPTTAAMIVALEGFTIRGGQAGVRISAVGIGTAGRPDIRLFDMRLDGCRWGIASHIQNFAFGNANQIRLERTEVLDCVEAGVQHFAEDISDTTLTAIDCLFQGCAFGVDFAAGIECYSDVDVIRSRFIGNTDTGLFMWTESSGQIFVEFEDSLVADNFRGVTASWRGNFRRSTIVNNTEWGLRYTMGPSATSLLREVILYGNGDDLDTSGSANLAVQNCNIGDGDHAGVNGNISVDPLFRDPWQGDYRLGYGTGCVDGGPAGGGFTDITGFARGNDGDLDFLGARDMGAFELRTLSAPPTIGIGEKLHIDIHAEPGEFTALWLARGLQLPTPDATPFGLRWLPADLLESAGTAKVLSTDPARKTILIPNDPTLIGSPFSFQALSRSANPVGAAWTDAVTVFVTL